MLKTRHTFLEAVIVVTVVLFAIYNLDNPLWVQLSGISQQVVYLVQLGLTKLTAYLGTLQ